MNEEELRNLMFTAQQENMGPFVIATRAATA
jgi:1-deoxy-D-xylulose-5-phosphate synthase